MQTSGLSLENRRFETAPPWDNCTNDTEERPSRGRTVASEGHWYSAPTCSIQTHADNGNASTSVGSLAATLLGRVVRER